MSRRDSAAYRRRLLAKKADLLKEIGGVNQPRPDQSGDEGEQAVTLHADYISITVGNLVNRQLRDVDEALDRIEAGDYGLCAGCGDHIPRRRLRLIPWARFCVQCQENKAPAGAQQWWNAFCDGNA